MDNATNSFIDTEHHADLGRLYTFDDGSSLPSVTSILSVVEKPGLERWKQTTKNWREKRDRAALVGTLAHHRCLQGLSVARTLEPPSFDLGDVTEDVLHDVEVCQALFDDVLNEVSLSHAPRVETLVVNQAVGYAGRADVLDRGCVYDIKTSQDVYDSHRLQVAAYARAAGVDSAAILLLDYRNLASRVVPVDVETWYAPFLDAVEAYTDRYQVGTNG